MKSAPRAQLTPLKDQFSTLYSAYVMDEQLAVHEHVLGGAKSSLPASAAHAAKTCQVVVSQVRPGETTMPALLSLTEDLTIYHALEQKRLLLDALAAADDLELDLAQVSEIDSAGLQLLILLKNEALRAGKRVSIVAHSQSIRSVIDFCNLAAVLGDPLLIPAAEAS